MSAQFDLFNANVNMILGAKSYEEFKDQFAVRGCTACRLSETRTNIVIDRGNYKTKVMVVGEGPGEQEDLKGQAFVGRAGQLLDDIMKAINLDTNSDMLIANVIKCRPPKNRLPYRDEVSSCLPYLKKQIELMQPNVILLLGATAVKHLVPEKSSESMEQIVGKFFTATTYPGVQFMPLYHPAFLLRDPRKKRDMWEHVKGLKSFLDRS